MRLLALCFAVLLMALPADAAAPVSAPAKTPQATAPAAKTPAINPLKKLEDRTNAIMKNLNPEQAQQFAAIRTSHGAIRGVDNVRASLDRAVKSCAKANPGIKDQMEGSYQSWKNAVLPVMRRAENRMEKLILLQTFTRPSQMRAYLKLFDDAVNYQNNQFVEVPVSEKGACTDMADNMDDSRDRLIALLTQTLGLDKDPEAEVTKPVPAKSGAKE